MAVHRTALIADGAQIAPDVEVGPYAIIGPQVKIGAGTKIGAHAVIDGITTIGEGCNIFVGASIGLEPQDLGYKGEPTGVTIGNRVTIREYATIHRATISGGSTIIEDDCFLMNYTHVAHDCRVEKGVIMANGATLAGHVHVGPNTVMAGQAVFHQFVRIGRLSMISGFSGSRNDVPPFSMVAGNPPYIHGINIIGMRRAKVGAEARTAIKSAYRVLYRSGLNFSQAIAQLEQEGNVLPEVQEIIDFYQTTKRGVLGLYSDGKAGESENGHEKG
jgi:UDP-N-acetylglucosamine acyltransferase